MAVSPGCLERGLSSTPSHHQAEGRPPAFQASRATRATNSAVASAACLEGPRGARYPICGCIGRPAFPTPSIGRRFMHNSGASRRGNADVHLVVIARSDLSAVAQRAKAEATKQSSFLYRAMDCFASLAMTVSRPFAILLF